MSTPSRYEEQEPLTPKQVEHFKELLIDRRARLLSEAEEHADEVKEAGGLRIADEVDLATAEYDQAFEHRMRDREKGLIKKLDKVLRRIEEGEYDECNGCGNYIGIGRLSARPEATLCIECKEEEERLEAKFKDQRETDTRFPFK